MATVIDALVVELGFDISKLQKGQKEANTALGKISGQVHGLGGEIQRTGAGIEGAFSGMTRQALAFFAVLTAGKTLKAFVSDTTASNVAAQNMARNLGTSVRTLTAWQTVATSMGGSADGLANSMQGLVGAFQTIEGRQNLTRVFGQMGVQLSKDGTHIREMTELLPDLAQAAQRLGPQVFSALAGGAGIDAGTINMLEQGPEHIKRLYQSLREFAPTDEDTKASSQLLEDWTLLTAQSASFGRSIMTDLSPEIHDLFSTLSQFIREHRSGWLQEIKIDISKIGDEIKNIDWHAVGVELKKWVDEIRDINWDEVSKNVKEFGADVNGVVQGLGGWVNVTKTLIELWAGSKFLGIIANLSSVVGVLRTMGVVGAGALTALEAGAGGAALLAGATPVVAGGVGAAAALTAVAATAYGVHKGLQAIDPDDKAGQFFDKHSSKASFVDNLLSHVGLGRSYAEQEPLHDHQATELEDELGISQEQYEAFRHAIAGREGARYDQMGGYHNAYVGKYQLGKGAIEDVARYLNEPIPSNEELLKDPDRQEQYFEIHTLLNARNLKKWSPAFATAKKESQLELLGYGHNQGAAATLEYIGSRISRVDGNGTPGTTFIQAVAQELSSMKKGTPPAQNPGDDVAAQQQKAIDAANAANAAKASRLQSIINHNNSLSLNVTAPSSDPYQIAAAARSAFDNPRTFARLSNTGLV